MRIWWYAHSENRKKSCGQRICFEDMTVIEFLNKDPTKNVYLVIIYKKT
jgi:hypothetical protein